MIASTISSFLDIYSFPLGIYVFDTTVPKDKPFGDTWFILKAMQQLNEVLKNTNYQPVFTISIALAGLLAGILLAIIILHTLQILGRNTLLYRGKKPVEGWSRQFYPASFAMITFLLILMWLLNVWRHTLPPQ